ESSSEPETQGAGDTRPRDGFNPNSPQQDAGIRIEPPPSEPCAIENTPAATAAAAPPDDPPGVLVTSHGLRHAPFRSDSVTAVLPNSGVFDLPTIRNPASFMRRTTAASCSGTLSAKARDEYVVRTPPVSVRSLTSSGTPANGPLGSGSLAAASACSEDSVTGEWRGGGAAPVRSAPAP